MMRILFLTVILFTSFITFPANAADDYFNSPLVDAADQGKVYEVVKLLKSGTSPNVKGEFGTTALMRAAYKGNLDTVKILIEAGANINLTDMGGATALHLASRK